MVYFRVKKNYSSTLTGKMLVKWRCSACGTENEELVDVKGRGSEISDYGVSDATAAKKQAKAATDANKDLTKQYQKIARQSVKRRYHTADLKCTCSSCGNREGWAEYNSPALGCYIPAVLGLLVGIIGKIADSSAVMGVGLAVIFLGIGFIFLVNAIMRSRTEKKYASLPDDSLPHLLLPDRNTGELLECIPGNEPRVFKDYEDIFTPAAAKVRAAPVSAGRPNFCPACGSRLKPGSRFCEMCGSKIG